MSEFDNLNEDQAKGMLKWIDENVLKNPEHGLEIKRRIKKIEPRINFPDVDLEDRYDTKAKEQEEKIDKFLKEQQDKENKKFWEGERARAQDSGLVTPEEREEFEKWMVSEHLGNYQRAAKMWHDERHTAAEPTNYQDVTGIKIPNSPGLFENPVSFARNEALKVINEINREKLRDKRNY